MFWGWVPWVPKRSPTWPDRTAFQPKMAARPPGPARPGRPRPRPPSRGVGGGVLSKSKSGPAGSLGPSGKVIVMLTLFHTSI